MTHRSHDFKLRFGLQLPGKNFELGGRSCSWWSILSISDVS